MTTLRTIRQKVYSKLYRYSLKKMGFGEGGDPHSGYEKKVLEDIVKRSDKKPMVVFDIGANAGEYVSILLPYREHMKIYAFEPSPTAFLELQKKYAGNSIQMFNIGFNNVPTRTKLFSNYYGSASASIYQRDFDAWNKVHTRKTIADKHEEVILETVDDFCAKNKIDRIDLMKIDAEGNEFSILKGSEKMLESGKIEVIQFEFGGCNYDSKTYFRDFWNLLNEKYHLYRVCKDGLIPIVNYFDLLEIFWLMNYIAIKK